MRLVDTSAWIEWLIESKVGDAVRPHLPETSDWLVPTVVQLELAKWLSRNVTEDRVERSIAFSQWCIVAPLTTEVALAAADLCVQCGLRTADAIVYATALAFNADLLTCDAHFADLPGVVYVPKLRAIQ